MPSNMFGIDWAKMSQQKPDPNANYNVNNAGQYGLNKFDKTKTENNINSVAQRQIDKDTGRVFRQGQASGNTDAEVSAYGATQSARDSRDKSLVGLDQYAHEDQYKLLNSMLGVDGAKLNRENLDFQKEQYEEQKPGFWDDVFAVAGLASNALPFFPDGGEVDSDKIINNNGGQIDGGMQNTDPNAVHDKPVNIQANEGERIMSPEANSMFAPALMAMENQAQQQKQQMPQQQTGMNGTLMGDGLAGAHGYAQAQPQQGGVDIKGMIAKLLGNLGGGQQQMMPNGGMVQGGMGGGNLTPEAYASYKNDKTLFDEYATMPQLRKTNLGEQDLVKYQTAIQNLQSNPFNQMTPEVEQWKQQYEGTQQGQQPNMQVNPPIGQGREATSGQTDFSGAQQGQQALQNSMFKPK